MTTRSGLRVLVCGMQSSGASLFTYYLAQMPGSLAVIDVWAQYVAPRIETQRALIAKISVNSSVALPTHVDSFGPTHTVLFVRNPLANHVSLDGKPYRDIGGTLEEKLAILEDVYRRRESLFGATIYYEEFVTDAPAVGRRLAELGLPLPGDALEFPRSIDAVRRFAIRQSAWCEAYQGLKWGCGNIHVDRLDHLRPSHDEPPPPALVDRVRALCPTVLAAYRNGEVICPRSSCHLM